MKQKLLIQLRYSEFLIRTFKPQFALQYSKTLVGVVLIVLLTVFCTYPLWKIGLPGFAVWCAGWLFAGALLTRAWLLYRLSACYLTTERCIDVDRPSLFRKEVTEYPLSIIQEVRYYSSGPVSMLFGAGTVVISPAHERGHIELRHVRTPEAIKELILSTCKRHSGPDIDEEL